MSREGRDTFRPREAAWAALFFLFATVLSLWPMAPRLSNGLPDLFDAKLTAWIFHWDFHQTFRDPLSLFDANIFHPARYALAFSENLYGAALFGFPLYAAGVSTLAAFNALFLLGVFLSGLSAWLLAREVTDDPAASLLSGVVYALGPWRMSQIPHVQFQWGPFLPLLLYFLIRYLRTGSARDRALFAVCLAWNALCNVHYAYFSGALLAAAAAWAWLAGGRSAGRRLLRLLPAAALAGIVVALFLLPYVRASRLYGMQRSRAEAEMYSGRPGDFLSAGARNRLYGTITRRFAKPEGDFFPGLVPFGLALLALRRPRRAPEEASEPAGEIRPAARRAALLLDVFLWLLFALWIAATVRSGLRIGPLRLEDPSRLVVFGTAALLLRWVIAFPRRFRYRNLGEFVRRGPFDPRMLLFAGVAAVGVVVALGLHTPYYRFLFDSCGPLFRAIRAPSRGVVLFHIGLGVLAAAGLSRLAGRFSRLGRRLTIAAWLLLVGVEYRAWPIDFHAVEAEPPPVYRWLARTPLPGAVLEWPLGFPADYEYEFRSTTHWKPIANGASGFAPPLYGALWAEMRKNTIPDAVWDRVRDVEASVLVFHPHDSPPAVLTAALGALRRGLAAGRLEILEALPHGPQDLDYVFRVASAPPFDARVPPGRLHLARESFENVRLRPGPDPAPPLLVLDFPVEGGEVSAGQWAFGWAADDSGIARVRVTTGTGLDVPATFGGDRPDVAKLLLGYADSAHPGLHFAIPALPPGEHVFVVTAQAVDGGKTELRRPVRVR